MTDKISALLARYFLISSLIFFCLILPKEIFGQNLRAVDVVPDQEKRSCIQTVDGYAYLSENMTLAEIRAAAFANAKRQALEAARTYIQSKTKVKNFEVEYDLLWSTAEGSVAILDQKDHGVENNTRYHVWIKAEVVYELKPKTPGIAQVAIMDADSPLTVKVWSDKKSYKEGEYIKIYVQGNRDFYARVVDVTIDGQIIQLLPNAYRRSAFFQAGKAYTIPGTGDQFNLKVTPPFGEEKLIVYASETPIGDIALQDIGHGLGSFRGSLRSLSRSVRAITPGASNSGQSHAEFYEATWALVTSP